MSDHYWVIEYEDQKRRGGDIEHKTGQMERFKNYDLEEIFEKAKSIDRHLTAIADTSFNVQIDVNNSETDKENLWPTNSYEEAKRAMEEGKFPTEELEFIYTDDEKDIGLYLETESYTPNHQNRELSTGLIKGRLMFSPDTEEDMRLDICEKLLKEVFNNFRDRYYAEELDEIPGFSEN